jgi:hypothetical protein
MHEEFVVGAWLAKRYMHMGVNEAWHHRKTRSVNCFCIGTIGSVDCEIFADCNDAITFEENVGFCLRGRACSVDDVSTGNEYRFQ